MLDEIESRLNSLELKCRRPVAHLLAGEYRSIFRGRGIEFDDVRAYQAGDDIRSMDWKVTARTGEPHIKRFIEEREQYFYLLVDVSASMLHGQAGRKRQTTAEVGSLLTLAATKNQDRVGLLLFTEQIEHVVPAGKSRRHALQIMDKLLNFIPEGKQTGYSQVLNRFGHMARKHSVVFVISDFLSEGYMDELSALACHHDVNAIHVLDHPQFESELSGMIRVEDAETGAQRVIDLNQQKKPPPTHRSRVRQQMQDANVNLLELEVGGDCVAALTAFFASRQRQINDNTGG
jgi:uncharacterized protein (DUF58 family)